MIIRPRCYFSCLLFISCASYRQRKGAIRHSLSHVEPSTNSNKKKRHSWDPIAQRKMEMVICLVSPVFLVSAVDLLFLFYFFKKKDTIEDATSEVPKLKIYVV